MHTKNLDFGYAVQSTSCAVEDGLFKYISNFVLSIPIRYLRLLHPFVVLWCCLFFCVVTQEWGERSTALACELCDVYVDTCSLSLLFISKFRVVHPHQVKRLSSDSIFGCFSRHWGKAICTRVQWEWKKGRAANSPWWAWLGH